MTEIEVNASKDYIITVTDSLSLFPEKVTPYLKGDKVAVVTDTTVRAIYGDILTPYLSGKTVTVFTVKSGEKSKNADNFIKIVNGLAEAGFTREDSVIAFGGGVVGDLAGFVASAYMRGITLIAVPTTLLSMIDSSVGGKTAINLKAGKNLCGSFYQPSAVYTDTEFLKSLPEKELLNGLGEAIKYAFLSDTVKKEDLKKADENLIAKCLRIKRDIVSADEKENGCRALLNLGHTVGHAIEKLSGYKIPHGVCVAKGMLYALEVSEKLYNLAPETVKEMKELLSVAGHDLKKIYPAEKLMRAIISDKKRRSDYISFITVRAIGDARIEKLTTEELGRIISGYESKD